MHINGYCVFTHPLTYIIMIASDYMIVFMFLIFSVLFPTQMLVTWCSSHDRQTF